MTSMHAVKQGDLQCDMGGLKESTVLALPPCLESGTK